MMPKTYILPYSFETETWQPVVVHFRLKGALGDAVPLQSPFEVKRIEGIPIALRVTEQHLADQNHSGAFTLELQPERQELLDALKRTLELEGTQRFVFEVKAKPMAAPVLPGMPVGTSEAAFEYGGTCEVKLGLPLLRIKQRSNAADDPEWMWAEETLLVDSTVDGPSGVRAVVKTFSEQTHVYEGLEGGIRLDEPEPEFPEAVIVRKQETGSAILQLDIRPQRFLVGTGEERINAFAIDFCPGQTVPPEYRWVDAPRLQVQVGAGPVVARIEVYERTANGKQVQLAAETRTLTGEIVEVRVQAGEPAPRWDRVYVDLTIEDPTAHFLRSHHARLRSEQVEASDNGAVVTFDLRLQPDTYEPTCSVDLTLSQMEQEGIWLFVAAKPSYGWEESEAISVRDLDIDEAALKALLQQGGHLRVYVHGTLEAPDARRAPVERPVVDLLGSLQVDDERSVPGKGAVDAAGESYLDFEIRAADGTIGRTTVRTRASHPLPVSAEVAEVLSEILEEAAALDGSLSDRAARFVEAAVDELAKRPRANLDEQYPLLLERLVTTRDFFGFARQIGRGIGLALDVREQIVMRQITNLIDGMVELASFGATEGYAWWQKGRNAKKAISDLTERSIRGTVEAEHRQLKRSVERVAGMLDEARAERDLLAGQVERNAAQVEALLDSSRPLTTDDVAFLNPIVETRRQLSEAELKVQSLEASKAFYKSQEDACIGVAAHRGDAFYEKLDGVMAAFQEREQQMPALMAELHRKAHDQTGLRLASTIANLRELQTRVRLGGRVVSGAQLTNRETTVLLETLDEYVRELSAIAEAPRKRNAGAAVDLEPAEHALATLSANAASESRETKPKLERQVRTAQPFENYSDMWLGSLWHQMDELAAGVSKWYYGSESISELGNAVAKGASELVQQVAYYLRMLTEWIDGEDMASLELSHLSPEAIDTWRGMERMRGDVTPFLSALEDYQKALKARAGLLDPARLSGTFDHSEDKKAAEEAAASRQQQRATRQLQQAAQTALVEVGTRVLQASALQGALAPLESGRFDAHDAQVRTLLHLLERLQQGVRLSDEDFLAWWPAVGSEVLGGTALDSWQNVENTVEWITFSAAVVCRGGAVLGTILTLGAGTAGGATALVIAEVIDAVGIALRVAIASAGSLRAVNAIPMDLFVSLAVCYDDVFRQLEPAES